MKPALSAVALRSRAASAATDALRAFSSAGALSTPSYRGGLSVESYLACITFWNRPVSDAQRLALARDGFITIRCDEVKRVGAAEYLRALDEACAAAGEAAKRAGTADCAVPDTGRRRLGLCHGALLHPSSAFRCRGACWDCAKGGRQAREGVLALMQAPASPAGATARRFTQRA